MLVYNLNSTNDVFNRFPGVDGSAYVVGGLGMTVMKTGDVVVVPDPLGRRPARRRSMSATCSFTDQPTWNPF